MKILVTPTGFTKSNKGAVKLLQSKGWDIKFNTGNSIMEREDFLEQLTDADGLILGIEKLDREALDAAVKLKAVSRYGVGMDNIDLEYAKEKKVLVRNAAGANATGVADAVYALLFGVTKKVVLCDRQVREGRWEEPLTYEIGKKTLGLIGFGNIGVLVAKRAAGFDMKVLAYDKNMNIDAAQKYHVKPVPSIGDILREADIVSLHVPYLPETHHLIGERELALMKSNAVLINTARGGVVDEAALYKALKEKRLMGAGLDVFENEPLPLNSKLLELENVVLSPHCAADTFESIQNVCMVSANNLINMLESK